MPRRLRLRRRLGLLAPLLALPLLALTTTATASPSPAARLVPPPPMGHFSHPTRIDNQFFPLVPGTEFTYTGTITSGGKSTPHSVIFTVSDLTKVIGGVTTRVVLDRDFLAGELEESELAFFAQDDQGTVWLMGELPLEFTNGHFSGAPDTWINGLAGAMGGPQMLAHQVVGRTYTQGLIPRIDFFDTATVKALGQRTCVPVDCFNDVLLIDETSPLDPTSGIQTKFYAPGVGLVRVGAMGGADQERLVLARLKVLSSAALQAADQTVRMMDRLGLRVSNVYSRTAPVS